MQSRSVVAAVLLASLAILDAGCKPATALTVTLDGAAPANPVAAAGSNPGGTGADGVAGGDAAASAGIAITGQTLNLSVTPLNAQIDGLTDHANVTTHTQGADGQWGGRGGAGDGVTTAGSGGTGGKGGDAAASASFADFPSTPEAATSYSATSVALGGSGGVGGLGGSPAGAPPGTNPVQGGIGGNGGDATADALLSADVPNRSDTYHASATATGGQGGDSSVGIDDHGNPLGIGGRAGNGGTAEATASGTVTGNGSLVVSAQQTGGSGGFGRSSADGGDGADSTMINAVAGSSDGSLFLRQNALAGNGGGSHAASGGAAGDALSQLSLTDDRATLLDGFTLAQGGDGGHSGQGMGTAGGDASAIISLASTRSGTAVSADTTASSGYVGSSSGIPIPRGNAVASAEAASIGGGGSLATAHAAGRDGSVHTTSISSAANGAKLTTTADAPTHTPGFIVTQTFAVTGGSGSIVPYAADAGSGTHSFGYLLPDAGSVGTALSGHPDAAAAVHDGTAYGLGSMGVASNTSGTTDTLTASALYSFDVRGGNEVTFSLLDSNASGDPFDSLVLSIFADNSEILSKQFGSLADASLYFSDNTFSLGQWTNGTPLNLSIILGLTTSGATDFAFNYLLGGTDTVSTAPIPTTILLFSTGLCGLGLLCARKAGREVRA